MRPMDLPGGMEELDQDFDPEEFRALVYGHPKSVHLRWFKAFSDPTYNPASGLSNTRAGKSKFLRIEQEVTDVRVLIRDVRAAKRFLPQGGEFLEGDLAMTYLPDEIDPTDHDLIIPLGKRNATGDGYETRLLTHKETLVRGADLVDGSGVVSASGATITGVGTAFLTEAAPGDTLAATGGAYRILAIASDTSLTLDFPPAPAWNGNSYQIGGERLLHTPAVRIEDIRTADQIYFPGVDFDLDPNGQRVRWLSPATSPLVGTPFAVSYRFLPRYEAMPDMGVKREAVNGIPLPQTLVLRLVQAESSRSS